MSSFSLLMDLLVLFASRKKNPHRYGSIVIFDVYWLKIFLQTLARVLISLIWKKSGALIIHI